MFRWSVSFLTEWMKVSQTNRFSTVCKPNKESFGAGAAFMLETSSPSRRGTLKKMREKVEKGNWDKEDWKARRKQFHLNCSHSGRAGQTLWKLFLRSGQPALDPFFFSALLTGSALVFRVTFQLAKPPEVWIQAGRRLPGQWLLSYSVIRNMEINFSQSQL